MTTPVARMAAVAGAAVTLLLIAAFAPAGLRSMDAFSVQRVEVSGTRHMTGRTAVEASGITAGSNVFDDIGPWQRSLRRHPLVADARIERRPPSMLVITIVEAEPVAFARTPELRAIDRTGRVLPTDPTHDDMDLPVLAVQTTLSADGRATDAATQTIATFITEVLELEPALFAWVSEITVHDDAIRLVLRNASDAEVLVPARPTADRLERLHATLEDLATPRFAAADPADGDVAIRTIAPELSRVRRIDARYAGQIVVAMNGRKS